MHLHLIGINHQTAPLAVREQFAFTDESVPQALAQLHSVQGVKEVLLLSTCNRTEIYFHAKQASAVLEWLSDYHHLSLDKLQAHLYHLSGEQVARHAFKVASGLDSMVLGETQILGQIKQAVAKAEQAACMGVLLNGLFQRAFSAAKAVRSQTDIGEHSVSLAAASVRLAEQIFPSWAEAHILLIGAGEMIELCATHLAAQHPKSMAIANRTLERGQALAQRFAATPIVLQEVAQSLAQYDIVVTSTAAPLPIIGKGMVERALKQRKRKPMLLIDLAVPRDIEPEVAQMDDVFLYTVDDLSSFVQVGLEKRRAAVKDAEKILHEKVADFKLWWDNRALIPLIRGLQDHGERLRRHELERALKALSKGDEPAQVLEQFSHALHNKFLHTPIHALQHSDADYSEQLQAVLARLYHLEPES